MVFDPSPQVFPCLGVILAIILNVISVPVIRQNIGVLFLGVVDDVGVIVGPTGDPRCEPSFLEVQEDLNVVWQVLDRAFALGLFLSNKDKGTAKV